VAEALSRALLCLPHLWLATILGGPTNIALDRVVKEAGLAGHLGL
jgi:hypothetical protein